VRLELSLDLNNISHIHKNYINIAHVISPLSPYNVRRNNAAQLPKACDTIEMWIFVHESVSFLVFITFQGDTPVRMLMQTMFLDFMVIINGVRRLPQWKLHTTYKESTLGSHLLQGRLFWKYRRASFLDFQLSLLEELRIIIRDRRILISSPAATLGVIIVDSTRISPMIPTEARSG